MADALHEIAITGDDIGLVIDEVVSKARVQQSLGERHADGVRYALTERPCRRFDAGRMPVFRMTRTGTSDLPETPNLIDPDVGIAGKIEQRIEKHRPMPRR